MMLGDPQLRRHYERAVSRVHSLPKELVPIFGLMDAYSWLKATDGVDSARVQEVLSNLTSHELRGTLKAWYLWRGEINPSADAFRHTLEQIIAEELPLGKP